MKTHRGFTLIELLVVIMVIVVLVAIVAPVFSKARNKAKRSACLSSLKQLSLAYMMYCDDQGYKLHPAVFEKQVLEQALRPFLGSQDDLRFNCPSDKRAPEENRPFYYPLSYGWNALTLEEAKGRNPLNGAQIPLVFDALETRINAPWELGALQEDTSPLSLRHNGGLNVAFFDGHVKWLSRKHVEDGAVSLNPQEKVVWSGDYLKRPKTAEKAAFPEGAEVPDGVYVFRVKDGQAEHLAGPLKEE